jgi:hypothetical protein
LASIDFLFTPTVQRVLGATLSEPARFFTLQDLLRRAGSGRGGAQLQINRLLEAGVLREGRREGNQRRIAANTEFFLYAELRAIAMKSFGLAFPIRDALQTHAPQVQQAFVFGAAASVADNPNGDVDLLLVGLLSVGVIKSLTSTLTEALGRPFRIRAYENDQWDQLLKTDAATWQFASGPKLHVLP